MSEVQSDSEAGEQPSSSMSEIRSDSEAGAQQSQTTSVEEVTSRLSSLTVASVEAKHPWENADFVPTSLSPTISDSEKYKKMVPDDYRTGKKLNMYKIIGKIPFFLDELIPSTPGGNGAQTPRRQKSDRFEARSVANDSLALSRECRQYIDCDGYCLKSHVPVSCMEYFGLECEMIKQIKEGVRDNHRWVFTPSFRRPLCGLFDWKEASEADDLIHTHQVIVVRPSQFQEYQDVSRSNPTNNLIIVSLPEEINGIGYARNWILKMAGSLGLRYVWVIDDSVLWFREFNPENSEKSKNISFKTSFTILENVAKKHGLAAFGPRVYNGLTQGKVKDPFMYKPPRGVVFLDLKQLSDKKIMYRSQLTILEDMVFGYECEKVGLKVCVSNRIHFYDVRWNKTGTASSISSPAGLTPSPPQQPSINRTTTPQSKPQALKATTPQPQKQSLRPTKLL